VGCAVDYSLADQILSETLVPIGIFILMRVPLFRIYGAVLTEGYCIYLIQLLAFIVLPSTSLTLFTLFDCTHFPDGKAFVTSDLSMQCYTPKHQGFMVYSSFMLLVFPIGIPMGFFALLYPKREAIASRNFKEPLSEKLQKYRFLLEDYKPSHWHGEVFRSWMRVILSGGVVVLSGSTAVRASFGSLFAFLFVLFQREYQPFAIPFNNALGIGAQFQILFTYVMAFFIVTSPIAYNSFLLGVLLLLANLFVFVFAFVQQLKETKRKARLNALREEVKNISSSVTNIVGVRRGTTSRDLTRFVYGDWAALSPAQRRHAASSRDLNTQGVQSEEELSRFLAVSNSSEKAGLLAKWYWQEDEARMSAHAKGSTFGTCWVAYADSVAAQFEYFYENSSSGSSIVQVDVSGRVSSSTSKGKAFASESGNLYSVDLKQGIQINAKTKYERKVMRRGVPLDHGAIALTINKQGGTTLASDDDKNTDDNLEPKPFPAELASAGEPILFMKPGMLVQIQQSREDEWAYGVVIFDPEANKTINDSGNGQHPSAAVGREDNNAGIQMTRVPVRSDVYLDTSSSRDVSLDEGAGGVVEEDATGSKTNGWFPQAFSRHPSVEEMHAFQEYLGGQGQA